MDSAGGGGYGDPNRRDRAAIERDLAEGKVSRAAAVREYGYAVATAKEADDVTSR